MTNKENEKAKTPKKVTVMRYVYCVQKVLETKHVLFESLRPEFVNKLLDHNDFDRLVSAVCATVPGSLPLATVKESLRNLPGKLITGEMLQEAVWRIAGNVKRLRRNRVVPYWHQQQMYEWVPAQIMACRRKSSYDKRGAEFQFRIMAGTSASLATHKWWSLPMCNYVASQCGFTRARGRNLARFPYSAPEQLVGFRMNLFIDPTLCGREPGFRRIAFGSAVAAWNKETLRCRFRVHEKFRCPLNFSAAVMPCHACPKGYTSCRAGTHKKDWFRQLCHQCRTQAWFDPERPGLLCLSCLSKKAYEE